MWEQEGSERHVELRPEEAKRRQRAVACRRKKTCIHRRSAEALRSGFWTSLRVTGPSKANSRTRAVLASWLLEAQPRSLAADWADAVKMQVGGKRCWSLLLRFIRSPQRIATRTLQSAR